jgi:hypothetical protein
MIQFFLILYRQLGILDFETQRNYFYDFKWYILQGMSILMKLIRNLMYLNSCSAITEKSFYEYQTKLRNLERMISVFKHHRVICVLAINNIN